VYLRIETKYESSIYRCVIVELEKILILISALGRDSSNNLSISQTNTREHPANCLI